MCGLAGYARLSSRLSMDASLLDAMQRCLMHRGPDGSGIWLSDDSGMGLAHRRLSIVDVSAAGLQPMISNDGTVVVAWNGEIYNHQKLRKELEALGYVYRSQSDTETILYAYQAWGIACLEKFEGMFAIALVDTKRNELYLVRDRIGIKPLYFSLDGGMLSFASEIKALWVLPWMRKEVNQRAVSHYLTFLVPPAPMTLYKGVYKLPAGHYLKLDAKRVVSFCAWYSVLTYIPQASYQFPATEEQCVATVTSLLRKSVTKRLMADVPIGAFLSGGVDSSLIVGLMAEQTDRVKTFNISFDDERDERVWARKVARHFNTEHHELVIGEQEAFNFFQKMVYHQDEPIGDCVSVPIYYVSKLAKESGVTVMLTGEGADELFCGYPMYAKYLAWDPLWRQSQRYVPAVVRRQAASLVGAWYKNVPGRVALVQTWAQGQELFWGGAVIFNDYWKQELTVGFASEDPDPIVAQLYPGFAQTANSYDLIAYLHNQLVKHNPQASPFTHMLYRELHHRLPELLLTRLDKMTMAVGIEGRVPFLDPHLVQYALTIPQELQLKHGVTKYVLKKAAESILPHEIIYRQKIGFAAPVTHWFRHGTYFRPYLRELMHEKRRAWGTLFKFDAIEKMYNEHQASRADFGYQLWVIQNMLASDSNE